jgi:hypothetical protein
MQRERDRQGGPSLLFSPDRREVSEVRARSQMKKLWRERRDPAPKAPAGARGRSTAWMRAIVPLAFGG